MHIGICSLCDGQSVKDESRLHLLPDGLQVPVPDEVLPQLDPGQPGAARVREQLEETLLWLKVAVGVDQLHVPAGDRKSERRRRQTASRRRAAVCVRVDEFVADFAGQEDVGAHAELVPEALVAHGLPQVPQAEHGGQRHQAVRVVARFGCHVRPALLAQVGDGQNRGPEGGRAERQGPEEKPNVLKRFKRLN